MGHRRPDLGGIPPTFSEEQIRPFATEFIPFDGAWADVVVLVSRLSIPD
jgi:hypothetical protein